MTNLTQPDQQIDQCLSLMKEILKNDLLAMYLYGSSVYGGLQKFSDIDLLVVSKRQTTNEEKALLASKLLKISGLYGIGDELRPIELTLVVKSDINPWRYPSTFDFLYGEWLRKDFEAGDNEPWPTKIMPDLAILITQIILASKVIYGPPPIKTLDTVPYRDFIIATVKEIDNLLADLKTDTRNVLLTLARIWITVETDTLSSKSDAATWAINKLPEEYKPIIVRARSIMLGEKNEHWEDLALLLQACADFMVDKIKEQTSLIRSSDYTNRSIKLAEK